MNINTQASVEKAGSPITTADDWGRSLRTTIPFAKRQDPTTTTTALPPFPWSDYPAFMTCCIRRRFNISLPGGVMEWSNTKKSAINYSGNRPRYRAQPRQLSSKQNPLSAAIMYGACGEWKHRDASLQPQISISPHAFACRERRNLIPD